MTCQALWNVLPVAGVCHHASYSGSEGVLILPEPIRLPPENASHDVEPGDIGFTWFAPGDAYGVTREFAEVCWFYDRDARPSMHEGPAPVNLFARFEGDAAAFYARSRAMRRSGVTGLLIERLGGPEAGEHIAYHDPSGEAPFAPRPAEACGRLLSLVSEGSRCLVAESDDGGGRWSAVADLGAGTSGTVAVGREVHSPGCPGLPGGAQAGTAWAAIGSRDEGPIRLAMRDPQSATWGAARETGLVGSSPSVAVMPDGGLVILYRSSYGLAGARSDDSGGTWSPMRIGAAPEDADGPLALPCLDGRLLCAFRLRQSRRRDCLTAVER